MNTKPILFTVFLISILFSCQPAASSEEQDKTGMVKVTIMYGNGADKSFDMEYYENKHMPMLAELFGDAMKTYEIDKGLRGRTPEEPIPFLAIGYLYFNTLSDYEKAFGANAETILNDIPNYTNIQPIVQISSVIK